MYIKTKIYLIFLMVGVMIIVNSCKPVKTVTNFNKPSNLEYIYDSLKSAELNYKTINVKFNVKYERKSQTMSLKGNLKILKDSIIWISLSPGLGIEAARLMCTRDSIFFLDKLNGSLTKGKYQYLNNLYKLDVDYNSLQSILTNDFFIYPFADNEKFEFVKTFTIKRDSVDLSVYRKNENLVENLIYISKADYKVNSYLINDITNKRSLTVKYDKSKEQDQNSLPGMINIKSINSDKFLFVDLEYTKVTLNEELKFSFKVPDDYRIIVQ